ncbi:hypothetical protein PVL29_006458 [Vitis rotundifolia]|uniref:Uncharacterized protein n=1 Tax=Vitis rotundifolia TaxID=103349 RepID=A0AA39A515_VITRO|nr:hypothetical protein PVL29_006458 [Vitis rotundifolia]
MAATGLCLSPGSPTRSDVSWLSPSFFSQSVSTCGKNWVTGAVQVPPQQFEPSSKKDDPPTALTLSLSRIETYENEYESPPLNSTSRHNKVASPENQQALTFAMPEKS